MLGTVCIFIQMMLSYVAASMFVLAGSLCAIYSCVKSKSKWYLLEALERPLLNICPSPYRDDEECIFYTCPGDDAA